MLRGLYEVLRVVVGTCLRVYYPRITIVNGERLTFEQPGIIVSNHPNTLMDPLFSVVYLPRQSFFLVNAGLYNMAPKLLDQLYCVPIQRPQDVNGAPLQNDTSFERCENHLLKGGILYVAPEGTSYMNRILRPLRTGTVRIVLGAGQRSGFNKDIVILPIGITYETPNYSGSGVLIHVGEPLKVADWKGAYEKDSIAAARGLTQALEDRLREITIDALDEQEDTLVHTLEPFLPAAKRHEERFNQIKHLITSLRRLQATEPAAYDNFSGKVLAYGQALDQHKTDTEAINKPHLPVLEQLGLLAGLPVFLYAAVNHLFAYGIPVWLKQRLKFYIGYDTTVKMLGGMVAFPLFYYLQFRLAQSFLPSPWAWVYLLSLLPAFLLARKYRFLARRWLKTRRWARLQTKSPDAALKITQFKEEIRQFMVMEV